MAVAGRAVAEVGEGRDAVDAVHRAEGVLAQQDVQAQAAGLGGDPRRVAEDAEAGVRGGDGLGQAGVEHPADLDAAPQLLAQVLALGVGDVQRQGQLEHVGGVGAVDGADRAGRVPGAAVRAEVGAAGPGRSGPGPRGAGAGRATARGARGSGCCSGSRRAAGRRRAACGPGSGPCRTPPSRGRRWPGPRPTSAAGRRRRARASSARPPPATSPRGPWAPGGTGGRRPAPSPPTGSGSRPGPCRATGARRSGGRSRRPGRPARPPPGPRRRPRGRSARPASRRPAAAGRTAAARTRRSRRCPARSRRPRAGRRPCSWAPRTCGWRAAAPAGRPGRTGASRPPTRRRRRPPR